VFNHISDYIITKKSSVNLKTGLTNEWTNRVPRNVRRNIGMPMGDTDKDKSEFSLVSQVDVKRALAV
jgi:hypothetical protein